jgi:hypothetical protein
MRHYFAYGSNMDRAHMARLCPAAEALGLAHLDNWHFFVARGGFASIAPRRGLRVLGVLWRITASDRIALDGYEAVGDGLYQPTLLPVHHGDKLLRALGYVASDPTPGRPRPKYRELVLAAARDWRLPESYLRELERM